MATKTQPKAIAILPTLQQQQATLNPGIPSQPGKPVIVGPGTPITVPAVTSFSYLPVVLLVGGLGIWWWMKKRNQGAAT